MSLIETFRFAETKKVLLIFAVLLSFGLWSHTNAQDRLSFFPKDSTKNALTIYVLEFSLEKPLPSDAEFRFTFPDQFDLSMVEIAGSSTIKGGFKVKVDSQRVSIKRTGLGKQIPANQKADLKFALVKNPEQEGENYSVTVEIWGGDAGLLLKSEKNVSIK